MGCCAAETNNPKTSVASKKGWFLLMLRVYDISAGPLLIFVARGPKVTGRPPSQILGGWASRLAGQFYGMGVIHVTSAHNSMARSNHMQPPNHEVGEVPRYKCAQEHLVNSVHNTSHGSNPHKFQLL